MSLELIEVHHCFGGTQKVYSHWSETTNCDMRFALYLPQVAEHKAVPVLYWLSGLDCSEQNFITKAGAQRMAAKLEIALVVPDTSPRHLNLYRQLSKDNVGESAGFYVDAIEEPWNKHYGMYSYISHELPNVIANNFPIDKTRCGIFGHSMGGHGALVIGLRNPEVFYSLSAFSPICSAMKSPWGINAFYHYLGSDQKLWQKYDACHLMRTNPWPHGDILVDQGGSDPFLHEQLNPELLAAACLEVNVPLNLRLHNNYGHNYYFISSFIEDHLLFHAQKLV